MSGAQQGSVTSSGQGESQTIERSGLTKLMWFGVLQLVSIVAGWALSFYLLESVFFNTAALGLSSSSTPDQVSAALSGILHDFALLVPILVAIQLVAMASLTLGYWDLKRVDNRFALPSTLMLLMIIGSAVVAGAFILMINGLPDVIATAPVTPNSTPSQDFLTAVGTLILDLLFVLIGGIVAFVGFVGGQMLGLWRAGSRYGETMLKLGAIFPIVPLLNIVAPILVILGTLHAKERVGAPPHA